MINFQHYKLSNGLNLITASLKDTEAVTIFVLVGVGSRYETKKINGISHFLEHLFFKGTKKRPSTLKLSKDLDALGAKYNAFTGEEYTGFYIQAAGKKFKKAWEILSDMILNPLIPEREVERERGVILEEMNMYYDTPQAYVGELAKQSIYGDTPLGRDIIGTRKAIKSISREEVINYRKKYYRPSNMTIVVAGDENHSSWQEQIVKIIGTGNRQKSPNYEPANTNFVGPKIDLHYKKTDQTHLVINILAFPVTDKRWRTLEVLSNILGGQMSSRLFIKVRERKGLAYYIKSSPQTFHDTGLLSISAGLRTSNVADAIKIINQELKDMAQKKVGKEELARAKDNITGQLALSLEGSSKIAEFLCDQWFYEKGIKQPEQLIREYNSVSAEDIQKLAKELFVSENISITTIGPIEEKEKQKFEKIIK